MRNARISRRNVSPIPDDASHSGCDDWETPYFPGQRAQATLLHPDDRCSMMGSVMAAIHGKCHSASLSAIADDSLLAHITYLRSAIFSGLVGPPRKFTRGKKTDGNEKGIGRDRNTVMCITEVLVEREPQWPAGQAAACRAQTGRLRMRWHSRSAAAAPMHGSRNR